jgi:hypothetical protein
VESTFVTAVVVVTQSAEALLLAGIDECVRQRVEPVQIRDAHRAAVTSFRGIAPHEQVAVDGAGTSDHFPAHPELLLAVEVCLRLGPERPRHALVHEQARDEERDVDVQVVVAAPGFDQQDPMPPVRAQPVRDHAAGRAGAHDHIVELGVRPDRRDIHSPLLLLGALRSATGGTLPCDLVPCGSTMRTGRAFCRIAQRI